MTQSEILNPVKLISLINAIAIASDVPAASVGTQIIVAAIVGLLIAFAIQFLLTNLGLALGISLLRYRPQDSSKKASNSTSDTDGISLNFSFLAGLGILFTLDSVLFIACFFAVRFSTASDPISGATLGIIIWSTYFLILIWASYSAVGSVTDWVFGSIATQLRKLIKTIALSIQDTEEPAAKFLTEEAAANLVHQEIETAFGEFDLKQTIDDYLETKSSTQPDLSSITAEFANLLPKLGLESSADPSRLQEIDTQAFVTLIEQRTNLPPAEVEQVVEQLETIWQQAIEDYGEQDLNRELKQFLQSANPEELQFEQLVERLSQIVDREPKNSSVDSAKARSSQVAEVDSDDDRNPAIETWKNIDWRAIKSTLLNRIDLSEVELEDVWHNLQSLYQQIDPLESGEKRSLHAAPPNTINNDVEDYLWHAAPWYLDCEQGWQEFEQVIYDSQADPTQVRSQLEQIQPENFAELLQQRDDLDAEKIDRIVEHLAAVRQEVLASIDKAELSEQKQQLSELLKNYLQEAELNELQQDNPDNLLLRIERLLAESPITTEILTQVLPDWQQLDWHTWLEQRPDLEPEELKQTAEQLSKMGDRLLQRVTDRQEKITLATEELQQKLESYLRYTNLDHLTPAKIDAKLEKLGQEAVKLLPSAQQQLLDIDRSELENILENRKGIDVEQVEQVITQIETNWQKLNDFKTPEISQLQIKTESLSENLVDYLYQSLEQNLSLAEIEADLHPLLNLAQDKTKDIVNQQLAQLNWNEVETQLKQVQKYSEQQIKQKITQARKATYKLVRMPRRWATRTSQAAKNLVEELEDFARYGNKIEFTSEHLKHNLESIFHRSKTQSYSIESSTNNLDRLAQLTPDRITEFFSERQDLTSVEVTRISERLSQEIELYQEQKIELAQDLLERFGEYFSSLDLFRFDYDRIKHSLADFDFQSLTSSWQEAIAETPLEKLGDYLGQFSQETLSKIVQTNDSTLTQIQGIQDYLAQQIEATKLTAYERAETIKQQTWQKVETTRKAIAVAAYWILAISFTSAIVSALAGYLATIVSI